MQPAPPDPTSFLSAVWPPLAATLAAFLVAYAALLVALTLFQRRILFRPDPAAPIAEMVGQPGLETITLGTADGLALVAWLLPPPPGAPIIVYLHGNAGHMGHRGARLRRFAAQGWGVLMVEYRGYGGNPGLPSEAGLIADGQAGLSEVARRGITADRVVLWGESLGTGVAVPLAGRNPVAAVVLETPFTSIAAIARARYPFVPVDLLLRDRFDSLAAITSIRAPLLIAQGGRDTIVPPAMGRTLLAAATAPAEIWYVAEGGHSDLADFGLVEAAGDFLRRHAVTTPALHPTAAPHTLAP